MLRRFSREGHSLLELIVATGIFVVVSVALSGVWVMYGRSLAKSGEVMAANAIARSITEGLTSNGWEWLRGQPAETEITLSEPVIVERVIRNRRADIQYQVSYLLTFNDGTVPFLRPGVTGDVCKIEVFVDWRSTVGATGELGDDHNNRAVYSACFYKHGI
jgi:type II secretory pathway pseudopilin PulG